MSDSRPLICNITLAWWRYSTWVIVGVGGDGCGIVIWNCAGLNAFSGVNGARSVVGDENWPEVGVIGCIIGWQFGGQIWIPEPDSSLMKVGVGTVICGCGCCCCCCRLGCGRRRYVSLSIFWKSPISTWQRIGNYFLSNNSKRQSLKTSSSTACVKVPLLAM